MVVAADVRLSAPKALPSITCALSSIDVCSA